MKIKNLKFNNVSITFAQLSGNTEWCIPAKLLGLALGYPKEGQKLADAISGGWAKKWLEGVDYWILQGKELANVRKETPQFGVSSSANSVLLLTVQGVVKVLQRSRAGLAGEFRDFLAKNHAGIFKEHLGALKAPPEQMGLGLEEKGSQSNMADIFKILEVGSKKGLMTQKEQKLVLSKILDIKMTALSREHKVSHVLNPDGTVNPTSLPAMTQNALATNEGQYRLLGPGQHHPAYMDWLSAEDIGKPYGLKADLVKKYIKARCLSIGSDLPNNLGREYVRKHNGSFPIPDTHGYIVFDEVFKKVGGVAIYSKMGDNQLVWRNFWSPEAVREIERLVEQDRGIEKPAEKVEKASQAVVDAPAIPVETVEEHQNLLPPN